MALFDEIKPGARLKGIDPSGVAEVVQVSQFGPDALNLVFRANGKVGERLVYHGDEAAFEVIELGRTYGFDADGALLRLASEAYPIRLAYLFDPYLAVTASQIEALPHQITAVYGEMLPPNSETKSAKGPFVAQSKLNTDSGLYFFDDTLAECSCMSTLNAGDPSNDCD